MTTLMKVGPSQCHWVWLKPPIKCTASRLLVKLGEHTPGLGEQGSASQEPRGVQGAGLGVAHLVQPRSLPSSWVSEEMLSLYVSGASFLNGVITASPFGALLRAGRAPNGTAHVCGAGHGVTLGKSPRPVLRAPPTTAHRAVMAPVTTSAGAARGGGRGQKAQTASSKTSPGAVAPARWQRPQHTCCACESGQESR